MILALRALGVGDLLTAVPALRGLRAAFPDRPLGLAAPAWLAPLVELVGGVDRLIPVDGLEPYDWGIAPPYRAVNLHGRGPQSHRMLGAARPTRLVAFACPEAGHRDGPAWTEQEREVDRWCRLLRWYGIRSDPQDLALRPAPPSGAPAGLTIVHPGGKGELRRWPAPRFAAVARQLNVAGHRVVITGSAGERALAGAVADAAGLPQTRVLAGRTDLARLAALVAHARLVVSADTGIAHLATAYRTPSVVLFGPVPPTRWGPPPERPWHRVLWRPELAGGRPIDGAHPALTAIAPEQVLSAVADVERAWQVRDAVAAQ